MSSAVELAAPGPAAGTEHALLVEGLTVSYPGAGGRVNVIEDVSFDLRPGETLGLVGESGSGKSMTALALLRLHEHAGGRIETGSIRFFGRELVTLDDAAMSRVRGNDIAMIFQDATSSLDPAYTVGQQIGVVVARHLGLGRRAARKTAIELLGEVGIPDPARRIDQYPHQFSGGMCQRVMIAMALSCQPRVLLADEPTTALDVTTQAQIVELLARLADSHGMSTIFTTHDLSLVSEICDRVAVMYAGQIVELGTLAELFDTPQHPYTQALLDCVAEPAERGQFAAIAGQAPALTSRPSGCRFHPRCPHADARCRADDIALESLAGGRMVRCVRSAELELQGVP